MLYADVVFNLKIEKYFTYTIPPELSSNLVAGQRVLAPFGNRELTGVIVALSEQAPSYKCKDIIDVLDEKPLVTGELLRLTKWMADYYMTGWGQVIQLVLPKGIEKKSNFLVEPSFIETINKIDLSDNQRHLFDIIMREPGRPTTYYSRKAGSGSFSYNLRLLQSKQLIRLRKEMAQARVRKKMIKFATIADQFTDELSGLPNREDLLKILIPFSGKTVSLDDFRSSTGLSLSRIKTLQSRNVIIVSEKEGLRTFVSEYQEEKKDIIPNEEQQKALDEIREQMNTNDFKVFLLHGVTGSGKTQVYLETIAHALNLNKSAIVLVPEISLTPQTVSRFESFFPGKISVFHSRMSLGERYDTWRKVFQENVSIVIGPRSALFLPVKNLGVIIIDEEHDSSYKQVDPAPRYHARDMAVYRARMNKAVVVLGSATPGMESYNNAKSGKYHLLELKKRIKNLALPAVEIVNMKKVGSSSAEAKILSPRLKDEINNCLEKGEQIILLQNRRGFSTFLQCKLCGFSNKCPNCDIFLTYHAHTKSVQCHYCGFTQSATPDCPKCSGTQIKYGGAGTQQIEASLCRYFPDIRILRMDIDTTSGKGAHERILNQFKRGGADVLLGTQMIAKGLDFDNVSLVGVINADIGLTLPDFRSAERIFQLMTQVAGRPGRTRSQGRVVIQTRLENHYAIKHARSHDYKGFYQQESIYRDEIGYPPFTRLIKIGINTTEKQQAIQKSAQIITLLKKRNKEFFNIIGPAPSPLIRLNNKYRWHIIVKINLDQDPTGKFTRHELRKMLWPFLNSSGTGEQVYIDVDPVDMM